MSADYRVDLTVGPYSWTRSKGDPPSLPEVLDGLTVRWAFPDGNLWPSQHEPLTAAFSLIAEDAADLDGIDLGTPVLLRVWAGVVLDGIEFDSITFTGTVGELTGSPVAFGHPDTGADVDGWILEVQSVDLTADLGEHVTQGVEFSGDVSGSAIDWVNRLFTQAGLPAPISGYEGVVFPTAYAVTGIVTSDPAGGTAFEPASIGEAAEAFLAYAVDAGTRASSADPALDPTVMSLYNSHGWRRMILRPNTDEAGVVDPDNPYRYEYVSRRYGERPGIGPASPAVFAAIGGGLYGLALQPPPSSVVIGGTPVDVYDASIVIDADYLAYDAAWTRSKTGDPNEVTVATSLDAARLTSWGVTPWTSVTETSHQDDDQVIGAAIGDTRLYEQAHARYAADMYLDDDGPIRWAASGFRWFASDDPSWPVNRSLFPGAELFGDYAAPVVIDGIPATQRPNGDDWYTGTVKSAQWTFERGGFYIDLDLYPRIPRPIVSGAVGLTWADLAADFPAVKWNDLDPELTWVDLRLARSALYT